MHWTQKPEFKETLKAARKKATRTIRRRARAQRRRAAMSSSTDSTYSPTALKLIRQELRVAKRRVRALQSIVTKYQRLEH